MADRRECESWEAMISRECDGELSRIDRESLEKHLEACAHCRSAREEMRELSRLASADVEPAAAARERLVGRIMGRIESDRSGRHWRMSAWIPLLAAASLLIAVLWRDRDVRIANLDERPALSASPAAFPASDIALLRGVNRDIGSSLDWIGVSGAQVELGLPEESAVEGVTVFGHADYERLSIELAPVDRSAGPSHSTRILIRPGVDAGIGYNLDGRHRVRFDCRIIDAASGRRALDLRLDVLSRESPRAAERTGLTRTLILEPGVPRRAGVLLIGGTLYGLDVTLGGNIRISPEKYSL